MASVTFYGACGCVTGSNTLLSWDGGDTQILVDCGLYQGDETLEQRNHAPFPFDVPNLEAVVITHAHLDHTGLLPKLYRHGYRGPVYCTKPTRGLMSLVLIDAGEIQEEQARYARKKGYSRHARPKPLYTEKDSRKLLKQVVPMPFDEAFQPGTAAGITVRYRRAGHLLGAASVEISAKGADGARRTWCFSGDIGRYGVPILKDPESPSTTPSVLVLESTYGDREHRQSDPVEALGRLIDETFAKRGKVIIPSFALGRSQEVLYYLTQLADQGRLDPSTVFLDSPMAISATRLYDQAEGEHDEELRQLVLDEFDPLRPNPFQHCRTVAQSKALNSRREPTVIVASSGMANGGRVVHHLLHNLGRKEATVAFVGYQAAGTRGRALLEGSSTVAIHGIRVHVKARIEHVHGLSAHADCNELVRWCQSLGGAPDRVFLNHGEDEPRKALAATLHEDLAWPQPVLPLPGTRVPW